MERFRTDLNEVERSLKAKGVSRRAFFASAAVAHSTWNRWKAGKTSPNLGTWERCRKAAKALCGSSLST